MDADSIGPLVRIVLRYFGAALITKAGLGVDVNDPDIQSIAILVAGALCTALSEGWYLLAKKRGWRC
ncbi:MAG TPA: hypothetical protein VN815_13225 [Steroidobacteraceae bacterium]|nr:hypothetical protein [Steroidobacteraceae bacterium]